MFKMNVNKMLQKLISPHFHPPPARPKKAEIMAFIRERHGTLTHFQCFLSIFKPINCVARFYPLCSLLCCLWECCQEEEEEDGVQQAAHIRYQHTLTPNTASQGRLAEQEIVLHGL